MSHETNQLSSLPAVFPVAYELDDDEANGTLHFFCSDRCRAEFLAASSPEPFGMGLSELEPNTVCEWCERPLEPESELEWIRRTGAH